jgi:hypothetical protein
MIVIYLLHQLTWLDPNTDDNDTVEILKYNISV